MVSLSGFLCLKSGDFISDYVVFAVGKGKKTNFPKIHNEELCSKFAARLL